MKTKNPPHFLAIDAEHTDQRIDNFLRTYLKRVPKSHIYRLLRKGEVRVNKKRAKPDYRLQLADSIRIPPFWQPEMVNKVKPQQAAILSIENHILFEDKGLMILNKPPGMPVHGGTGVSFGVIDLIRLARPKEKYLELAHRLDRETSGCLILVKKSSLLKEIHTLFREGRVVKVYWTLVKGHWSSSLEKIEAPLLKNQLKSGERMVSVSREGKQALTAFKVIQYFNDCTLVEVTLHTGRTHQIRVHAAYAGHPILGDEKYGDKEFNKIIRKRNCSRMFLHAKHLFLELPLSHQVVNISADLDADWQACLLKLRAMTMQYEEPNKEELEDIDPDDDLKSLENIPIDEVTSSYEEDYEVIDVESGGSKGKGHPSDHESLKARRALEEHLENKRLRKELDYLYDDDFMEGDGEESE